MGFTMEATGQEGVTSDAVEAGFTCDPMEAAHEGLATDAMEATREESLTCDPMEANRGNEQC